MSLYIHSHITGEIVTALNYGWVRFENCNYWRKLTIRWGRLCICLDILQHTKGININGVGISQWVHGWYYPLLLKLTQRWYSLSWLSVNRLWRKSMCVNRQSVFLSLRLLMSALRSAAHQPSYMYGWGHFNQMCSLFFIYHLSTKMLNCSMIKCVKKPSEVISLLLVPCSQCWPPCVYWALVQISIMKQRKRKILTRTVSLGSE